MSWSLFPLKYFPAINLINLMLAPNITTYNDGKGTITDDIPVVPQVGICPNLKLGQLHFAPN